MMILRQLRTATIYNLETNSCSAGPPSAALLFPCAPHPLAAAMSTAEPRGDAAALAASVVRAHTRLQAWRAKRPDAVLWTPLLRSRIWLEAGGAAPVYVKLESEQATGSFKVRGALNAVSAAADAPGGDVVRIVTASTGNHAMAMAHALEVVGVREKGRIYLPRGASEAKVSVLRSYSEKASLEFVEGSDCVLAEAAAGKFAAAAGALYVSPCDNYEVMSGNGTIAAELVATLAQLHGEAVLAREVAVYCCVGGGGMVSGVAAYLRVHAPAWHVIGCQPAASAVMFESVKAGRVVQMKSLPTLSDGSAGGLEDGCLPFGYCMELVTRWVTVSEDEISSAVSEFCRYHHKIVEGAAGVAIAAFLKDAAAREAAAPAVIIACGANIATETVLDVLQR